MVWHIFKKDVRLLGHYAFGLAVVRCFETVLRYQMDGGAGGLDRVWALLMVVDLCGALALITLLVHQDAIVGVRQDWLVRPVGRRELLGAKVLFVVLLMGGPVFLTNWLAAIAHGFSWESSLGSALSYGIPLLIGYYLPMLGYASLTRNLTETIVGLVVAALAISEAQQFITPFSGINLMQFGYGADWLVDWAELLLILCGAAAVLSIQYFRRKTPWARGLTVGVALLSLAVFNAPWQPVFAVQQRLSRAPGSASTIRVTFDPSQGRSHQPMGNWRDGRTALSLPIRISGLPPDSVLKGDWVTVDGKTVNLDAYTRVSNEMATMANGPARTSVRVPYGLFTQFQDRPMPLVIDYSLTLLRLAESHAIPASRGREVVPAAGDFWTSVSLAGTAVGVTCIAPDSAPSCMVLFLENSNTGARNPPVTRCSPHYAPVFVQMLPDAMYRTVADLPFRDAAGLAHYPVDGPQLWNSRVVMRIYKVADHFTRQLVIPDLRMSDWLPQ